MKIDKTRLKELLGKLKGRLENKELHFRHGMCNVINQMAFDGEFKDYIEIYQVEMFLDKNRPTVYNEYKMFTKNGYWLKNSSYWWERMNDAPETRQIRIDYLTALIYNIK